MLKKYWSKFLADRIRASASVSASVSAPRCTNRSVILGLYREKERLCYRATRSCEGTMYKTERMCDRRQRQNGCSCCPCHDLYVVPSTSPQTCLVELLYLLIEQCEFRFVDLLLALHLANSSKQVAYLVYVDT